MLVLRRLATALPSVGGIIIVTFWLTRALPDDPAVYSAGPAATQQAIAQIRHLMGFDRSLPVQFFDYLRHLVHGNLGTSLTTGQPVLSELATRLPPSAELTLSALLLSIAIALPLGSAAALRPGSPVDHACRIVTTAGSRCRPFYRSATGLSVLLPNERGAGTGDWKMREMPRRRRSPCFLAVSTVFARSRMPKSGRPAGMLNCISGADRGMLRQLREGPT